MDVYPIPTILKLKFPFFQKIFNFYKTGSVVTFIGACRLLVRTADRRLRISRLAIWYALLSRQCLTDWSVDKIRSTSGRRYCHNIQTAPTETELVRDDAVGHQMLLEIWLQTFGVLSLIGRCMKFLTGKLNFQTATSPVRLVKNEPRECPAIRWRNKTELHNYSTETKSIDLLVECSPAIRPCWKSSVKDSIPDQKVTIGPGADRELTVYRPDRLRKSSVVNLRRYSFP
jgi:hypothetical protein